MTYEITIEPLGEVMEVEEGQTLLDAALRAGIPIPYACGHGLCSTCKVEVLEGEVEQGDASPFALMDIEREEGKCLACCATPLSDLVIEADIDEDPDARQIPVADFTGVVSKIVDLSPRIKGITLALPEGAEIDFQAGQYVNLIVPGCEDVPRAFSIASPPSEKHSVELNVALVEGGKATTWLHNELEIGDELRFTGPFGRFYVHKSAPEPMIFLAGGSGLSSPKSMIMDLLDNGDEREMTLIYGARNQDELYYRELFEVLTKDHPNFHYVPALSDEPVDSDWSGYRGFVHEALKEEFNGRFEGHKAYLCGPPPMIDACVTTLMQGRLFENNIFMENFYNQSDKDTKSRSPLFQSLG